MKRTFTTTLKILMSSTLLITSAAYGATSTFDSGAEGWIGSGDIAAPIQWMATGGNPGGQVNLPDAVVGGVTYFQAPQAYLGNRTMALGTNLSFDLQQTISGSPNQFNDSDVILIGGGLTVVFDLSTNPNIGSWSHYEVPLSASLWHLSTTLGAAPTEMQFTQVLSDLNTLKIRAEYQTGADTGYLDNVSMVPEPEIWVMFLLGLGVVGTIRMWRTKDDISASKFAL